MRKKDLWILFSVVILGAVLGFLQFRSSAIETGSWGLSFRTEGQPPIGPASTQDLEKYDAVYVGDTSQKILHLPFDAGYENGNVEKILDVMKAHNAKGAFFILKNLIIRNTDLVKRMVEEAEALGADGIVNIRYASSAIMQGAAEVIVYGTAVKFV